jgi:hypothetical protein
MNSNVGLDCRAVKYSHQDRMDCSRFITWKSVSGSIGDSESKSIIPCEWTDQIYYLIFISGNGVVPKPNRWDLIRL